MAGVPIKDRERHAHGRAVERSKSKGVPTSQREKSSPFSDLWRGRGGSPLDLGLLVSGTMGEEYTLFIFKHFMCVLYFATISLANEHKQV